MANKALKGQFYVAGQLGVVHNIAVKQSFPISKPCPETCNNKEPYPTSCSQFLKTAGGKMEIPGKRAMDKLQWNRIKYITVLKNSRHFLS